jgi:hypothetical protein
MTTEITPHFVREKRDKPAASTFRRKKQTRGSVVEKRKRLAGPDHFRLVF